MFIDTALLCTEEIINVCAWDAYGLLKIPLHNDDEHSKFHSTSVLHINFLHAQLYFNIKPEHCNYKII